MQAGMVGLPPISPLTENDMGSRGSPTFFEGLASLWHSRFHSVEYINSEFTKFLPSFKLFLLLTYI